VCKGWLNMVLVTWYAAASAYFRHHFSPYVNSRENKMEYYAITFNTLC